MKLLSLGCLGLLVVGGAILILLAVGAAHQPAPTVARAATVSNAPPAAAPVVTAVPPTTAADPSAAQPAATSPAVAVAPTLPRVGERASSAGLGLTVNGVSRTDSLSQFQKAKPGRTFVVLDVTLDRAFGATGPYNPLYFKLKDADGFEYTASPVGGDQSLKSGELVAGEKVRGTVAFDVPADAHGLVMTYQPIVILGGYQPIRVALD